MVYSDCPKGKDEKSAEGIPTDLYYTGLIDKSRSYL